ncbi:MAG: AMP-binding protein [Actinomycetota bacterium]
MGERAPKSTLTERVRSLSELIEADRLRSIGVDLDATAMIDAERSVSWNEVDREVGALASALASIGVRRHDRVGVRMLKSVDSFLAVHAILRAGGVVVPLDPMSPPDAGRRVAADAHLTALVVDARAPHHIRFIDAVGPTPTILRGTATSPGSVEAPVLDADDVAGFGPLTPVANRPDDAAYVIYTSGSTGDPKGIVHTHGSALAYATAAAVEYELTAHDRLANFAPLHFDQSTFELYSAPLAGASVAVIGDAQLRFPASIVDFLDETASTVWYTVPSLLSQLEQRTDLAERDLASLRLVLYGGESFAPDAVRRFMAAVPGVTLSNVYGPAEVNQCTRYDLAEAPTGDAAIPIGRAWSAADTAVVRIDDDSDTVAVPETDTAAVSETETDGRAAADRVGELFVRSATAMRGYWHRADLTATVLVENPADFGEVIDRRDGRIDHATHENSPQQWLRTGDLVSVGQDGLMRFIGRRDHQVKVRGQRVELEMVDTVLASAPGVAEGVAVVDGPPDARSIVAIVVRAEPGDPPDVQTGDVRSDMTNDEDFARSVREYAAGRVPPVAAPSAVHVVDRLARTTTGKVSRRESLAAVAAMM